MAAGGLDARQGAALDQVEEVLTDRRQNGDDVNDGRRRDDRGEGNRHHQPAEAAAEPPPTAWRLDYV